jgi:hypothetical protein
MRSLTAAAQFDLPANTTSVEVFATVHLKSSGPDRPIPGRNDIVGRIFVCTANNNPLRTQAAKHKRRKIKRRSQHSPRPPRP